MQDERMRDFEQLGRKYSAIGPLLTKLEGVVVKTNTGKSPKMAPYYAHWEKRIFDTVYKVSDIGFDKCIVHRLKCLCVIEI